MTERSGRGEDGVDMANGLTDGAEIVWPHRPPVGIPVAPSTAFGGIVFTGRHAQYTGADTWYPSWASDGDLYSPWTDGDVHGTVSVSYNRDATLATTGQARIVGDDPLALDVVDLGVYPGDPAPYRGRYPCGSLVHDGVWYYGTYTLDDIEGPCGNWCRLGPFVGFRYSMDGGRRWIDTPHTPASPLFGESGKGGARVRIGSPHVVDFGRNMEQSPDGKAYLVGHGTSRPDGFASWVAGDEIYLIRVTPSIETMNDAAAYEFFAGHDAGGQAIWSKDRGAMRPLLTWRGQLGCVTITYNAALRTYLMCVSRPTDGFTSIDTMILQANALTGPWALVQYLPRFGPQAYFANIPSKFIAADGRRMWLCYSANFSRLTPGTGVGPGEDQPPGSDYALCVHEFYLVSA